MFKKIRLGLTGFAHRSQYSYADQFLANPYSEIVAVSDDDEERGKESAKKYNAKWYEDFYELLKRGNIDALSICSENYKHKEQVLAAAKEKKDVLCECPLASTIEDCDKIVEATKKSHIKLLVPFRPQYNATLNGLKDIVAQGAVGDLRAVYFTLLHIRDIQGSESWLLNPTLAEGGCILDLGSQAINYLLSVMKDKPERIYAKAKAPANSKIETSSVITIRFADGSIATTTLSWIGGYTGKWDMVAELLGSERTVVMDAYHQKLNIHSDKPEKDQGIYWGLHEDETIVNTFLKSIIKDEDIRPSGEDFRGILKLVLAAYKSAETGIAVMIRL